MKKKCEMRDSFIRDHLLKIVLMMKFTVFFLLIFVAQLPASVYSQQTKLKVDFNQATIKDVIEEIERQTDLTFFFSGDVLNIDQTVTLNAKSMSIDDILNSISEQTGLSLTVVRDQILVKNTLSSNNILKQQISISGRVTDSSGSPLPGVTVVVKGTTQGTITDSDGNYSLSNVPGDATLVFSFVGMKTQEIPVAGKTKINVILADETIGIEEIITVGYGIQRKASITGSVGSIKAETFEQRPAFNTTDMLQGQIAGLVTRQSNGLPGEDGVELNIRGFGDPLILVDGIESDLGQVDPNDIESISVLKDAAAAVYGARAGNGVILVTTKRGTAQPSRITYHGTYSVTQPTFLAKFCNALQWAELMSEAGLNPDDYSPNHVSYDPENNTLTNLVDGSNYEGYDWQGALLRDWTAQHQHNINAQGGNNKIRYFISGGYSDQQSNLRSGDYNFGRYNIRSNIDANITQNLVVSVDFAYRKTSLDRSNTDIQNVFNVINRSKPVFPYIHDADPTRATYPGNFNSPYFETFSEYSGPVENRENVIQGALEVKYSFSKIKGLVAKARLNYEDVFILNKNVRQAYERWEYDALAESQGEDPWISRGVVGASKISLHSERSSEILPLISLEYEKDLGSHHLKGMIISETRTFKSSYLNASRKNALSSETPYLDFASEDGKDNGENSFEQARRSIISRINYNYKDKYLLEFAMRADASAEYPQEGRWGYFPSLTAGWRISEESFLKNSQTVDNLKLRASYGLLGNDAISSFDYLTGFNVLNSFYIVGSTPYTVIASSGLANPDITWETMKISNIGLDGMFWDGKFGFELDAFYRLRENILAIPTQNIPSTFGASLPLTNLNSRDNRGFDIKLTHFNKINDLSYHISPIFSWSRGKYVDIDENVLPVTDNLDAETKEFNRLWNNRYVKGGQWDDLQWGLVSDGFFTSQQEIDSHPINQDQAGNQTLQVGDIKYKDLNGDNYIDWRDEKVIGKSGLPEDEKVIGKSGLPKIMYGLDLGMSYKGFSANALFQGGAAYSVEIASEAGTPFVNESIPLDVHYENRAILGTDSEGNKYITNLNDFKLPPVNQSGITANNAKSSDFWNYDARFIRLKSLNVSYTIPNNLITKLGFSNCVIYMNGTNLFALSNLGIWRKSFDPEVTLQNNRYYPPVKTITFGLKLTI